LLFHSDAEVLAYIREDNYTPLRAVTPEMLKQEAARDGRQILIAVAGCVAARPGPSGPA